MINQFTDKALLIADDEQAAFRVLYDRYWEPLYRKALLRLGNDADAQDLVQEVFISCWRNRQQISVENSLAPYLFTAMKYAIIKLVYRRAKKGIQVPLAVEELVRIELSTEELLQYKELQSAIAAEVSELPARMREIYHLSRIENLSIAEIAHQLRISEQTVKNTLHSALKRLREKLSGFSCWLPFFL